LVTKCTIANNGVSLTTHDALADSGADGYLFVSTAFAKRLRELLQVKRFRDFRPLPVGGFDNNGATQWINSTVRGHLTVQGRTVYDAPFLVIDSSHDVMIGRKWFEHHDVLIDCKRRRLLFPPEWEPDPHWKKGANIPLDQSPAKSLDQKAEEGIRRREKLMDEEDRRRRAGGAAVKKRIAELEAMAQRQPEPKAGAAPRKVTILSQSVRFAETLVAPQDEGVRKMERALEGCPPPPQTSILERRPRSESAPDTSKQGMDAQGPFTLKRDAIGWYKARPPSIAVISAPLPAGLAGVGTGATRQLRGSLLSTRSIGFWS
jgi:hypothetical protein